MSVAAETLGAKLQQVQSAAVDFFSRHFPLMGKVLEIGSDMDCAVASYVASLGSEVTALNPSKHFSPPPNVTALKDDARDMRCVPDDYFDAVISINTFEHIHALHLALAEIHRILKPGGYLGALFGPLWSSAKGHHLWAKSDDDVVSFWNPKYRNPVDDYAHLILSPNEMRADLDRKGEKQGMVEAIINAVYLRDDVNRWFYKHYIAVFRDMPLEIVKLEPHNRFSVSAVLDERLRARWGNHDFGVSSLRLIARKPVLR